MLETAKKNALNDLASEISVTVEGNSLLYTLDRKNQFDETFTSTIKTSTSEQIEGFELVDTWENGTEYWTYYRLSKAEHARIKAERKARSIASALDLHGRSKAALASGDLRSAFDQDLRALLAMKEYWGENDVVDLDGTSGSSGERAVQRPAEAHQRCAVDHAPGTLRAELRQPLQTRTAGECGLCRNGGMACAIWASCHCSSPIPELGARSPN